MQNIKYWRLNRAHMCPTHFNINSFKKRIFYLQKFNIVWFMRRIYATSNRIINYLSNVDYYSSLNFVVCFFCMCLFAYHGIFIPSAFFCFSLTHHWRLQPDSSPVFFCAGDGGFTKIYTQKRYTNVYTSFIDLFRSIIFCLFQQCSAHI